MVPVNYKLDITQATSVLIILENRESDEMEKIDLVTITPGYK